MTNELLRLRKRFATTGNPLFAWRAIDVARGDDWPIPGWCSDYLEETAWALLRVAAEERVEAISRRRAKRHARRNPGRLARQVMRALRFGGGRGAGATTAFSRYNTIEQGWILVAMRRELAGGAKLTAAAETVGEAFGRSSSHVLRCWRRLSERQ